MTKVSASLVLYKPHLPTVEQTLGALLASVRFAQAHQPLSFELTLVDNTDDAESFEQIDRWFAALVWDQPDCVISLRRAPCNLGYGRGNNLVIDQVASDYHLVINPDLIVREDALLEAVRYMSSRLEVGLLTPAVHNIDGTRQYLCKRNPTLFVMFLRSFQLSPLRPVFKSLLDRFEMMDCNYGDEIRGVSYPTGCFMFFRTDILKRVGGFDPKIFLHYEDADIGRRLLTLAEVNYVPAVVVTHLWARDTHKSWRAKLVTARSGWYYFRKWGGLFSDRALKTERPAVRHANSLVAGASDVGHGKTVLVSGANGFVGRAACAEFQRQGFRVRGAVRSTQSSQQSAAINYIAMGSLDAQTNWAGAMGGVDCVLHLAGRVHVMNDQSDDSLEKFRHSNVEATANLARQAAAAGVRRFIFISSVKVNGESTEVGQPFTASDVPEPSDPYGVSKHEAENLLRQISTETGMEVVIIRPPLVYGPSVKANFESMMRWLCTGVPLPLAAVKNNRRSMVALDNLVDLIVTCAHHPRAANQTFLVADGEDLSTVDLLTRMSHALGRPVRLFYVPLALLKLLFMASNKLGIYQRLCNSLQLDMTKTQQLLGWTPPVSVDEGLRRAAEGRRT